MDDYIGTAEATKLLRIGRVTLFKWEKQGKIKFSRIGRKKLYDRQEIIELIKSHKQSWTE